MLVVYEGKNETLICEKKEEKKLLKEYFGAHFGRNIEDYERRETKDVIEVSASARIWFNQHKEKP